MNKKSKQSDIFLESEADEWHRRNKEALKTSDSFFEVETLKRVLVQFRSEVKTILEVGCGNAIKLQRLTEFFQAKGSGIDPSRNSIQEASNRFKDLKLVTGIASQLPFQDLEFDLVVIGFCMYLIDREDIFRTKAEIDRVLRQGGYLAIVDFDPAIRHKNEYRHKPGVFSYKNSYAEFFLGGGHYYLVSKDSFSHAGHHFSIDSDERLSISVLYKEPEAY